MTCHYIVAQCGDLVRGEYLNVGIFAYNIDPLVREVYSCFVNNIERIEKTFGWSDPILRWILLVSLPSINNKVDLEQTIANSNSPYSSLQFTAPRPSVGNDAKRLAEEMGKFFLKEWFVEKKV